MDCVRHVIFDLDGTLVDSLPGIQWSVEAAFAETRTPYLHRDLKPLIGPPIRQILEALCATPNTAALDRLEQAFRRSYDTDGWRRTICQTGTAAMLGALADTGLSLWVVTNKPSASTRNILRHLRLAGFFQEVVCRDSRLQGFDSKGEMLADLLQRRRLAREQCLMVGDTMEDALAAVVAGIECILVPHGYGADWHQHPPSNCRRVRGWTELLEFCESLVEERI